MPAPAIRTFGFGSALTLLSLGNQEIVGELAARDLYGDFALAADLQDFPARSWTLTPRLRYMKNDSNIALYEYDRFEAVVYIRRGF